MKKVFGIIFTIIMFFLLYFFGKMLPDIYLNAGKSAYNSGNYQEAYLSLKKSIQLNNKSKDARYYYVQTLLKLPPSIDVQKELFNLSQVNLADSADLIADRQISKWRNQISSNYVDNYIERAPFNSKIIRWDAGKFPLKVCIENDSSSAIPSYYSESIKNAFLQWQLSTDNFIKIKFVTEPKDSEILVKIVPAKTKNCNESGCKYVVAYTTPVIKGESLEKMIITFYDSNSSSKMFSAKEIYNTALHEIGHSFGIMGHSYDKDNLMFMEQDSEGKPGENNFDTFKKTTQYITPADLSTLMLLYALIPDITNTPISEFNTSHQFFAPIVIGSVEQINSRKLLEAKNYIKSAPNLPGGYIDLATAYGELKEYNSAIDALGKALELSSNDDEKYIIYYNLGVIYMNISDWDNALKYANMAKQIEPAGNTDVDELIGGINHNKTMSH